MNAISYSVYDEGFLKVSGRATVSRGGFTCMRPCPRCHMRLHTDGEGHYDCEKCGYADTKDVSKHKKDLNYHAIIRPKYKYGKGAKKCEQ